MASNSNEREPPDGLWAFFMLTYALTLLTWGVMAVFQIPGVAAADTNASALGGTLYLLGVFMPSIVGVIMTWRQQGREGLRDLWKRCLQFRLGGRWYLVIIGLPLLSQIVLVVIFMLQGGSLIRPPFLDQPLSLLPLVLEIFVVGPISEEFGWRGFAQDRILARWRRPTASLILGLCWAFWHLPLFFIPGTSQQQVGHSAPVFIGFILQVLAITVLFTWVYTNTNRSLWGAILFHFVLNFFPTIFFFVTDGAVPFVNFWGVFVYTLLAVIVLVTTGAKRPVEETA